MMSKQEQVEKLLAGKYGFVLRKNVNGVIGRRVIMAHLYGLEVSISQYRVCFYSSTPEGESNGFPAKKHPCCFNVDKKTLIKGYLEKLFAFHKQSV